MAVFSFSGEVLGVLFLWPGEMGLVGSCSALHVLYLCACFHLQG